MAGVTVGLLALPPAMAFAIAAGLMPQAGIYCTIVTGFLISALGGSKTQIGGPIGAFLVVAGIVAALIASTQIKDFFGLRVEKVPGVFWLRMETSATHFWTANFEATALAVATVAILIACRMISNQVSGSIVELAFGTAADFVFQLPVETMGTRLGGIANG